MKYSCSFIHFGTKRGGRSCKFSADQGYRINRDGDTVIVESRERGVFFHAPWTDVVEAVPFRKQSKAHKPKAEQSSDGNEASEAAEA